MKAGWKTSEFVMAFLWWKLTVAGILALAFTSWPIALCLAPGVCVLVWMAGAICNNYGENRFLLKAERRLSTEDGGRKSFGFRSMAVQQEEESEEEEDEE